MSLRVFAWDANPASDHWLYRLSNAQAKDLVSKARAVLVECGDGRHAIQYIPTHEEAAKKSSGTGNLVPFGRTYNPLMRPPKLNYEIPHAGDCRTICLKRFGLRRKRVTVAGTKEILSTRIIKVSGRKLDFTAAVYARARVPSIPNTASVLNSQTA